MLRFTTRAKQAPGAGVKPTPAGSEPAVLPLDDPGMSSSQGGGRTLTPAGHGLLRTACLPVPPPGPTPPARRVPRLFRRPGVPREHWMDAKTRLEVHLT